MAVINRHGQAWASHVLCSRAVQTCDRNHACHTYMHGARLLTALACLLDAFLSTTTTSGRYGGGPTRMTFLGFYVITPYRIVHKHASATNSSLPPSLSLSSSFSHLCNPSINPSSITLFPTSASSSSSTSSSPLDSCIPSTQPSPPHPSRYPGYKHQLHARHPRASTHCTDERRC